MPKTKRFLQLALLILLALCVIFPTVWLTIMNKAERQSRLTWYRNTGTITLTVDGKAVSLDGMEVEMRRKRQKLQDGAFRFHRSNSGPNACWFTIPSMVWGGEKMLEFCVQFYSAHSWSVNHFNILIDVQDGNVTAGGHVAVKGEQRVHPFAATEGDLPGIAIQTIYLFANGLEKF